MRYNNATALRAATAPDIASRPESRLTVSLARSREEVKEAQRLRHRVFVEEMGAHARRVGNLERDRYDPFCIHLIVRDRATGEVVGTYRVLTPERAAALGSLMAESEFDLTPLAPLRARIVEVGRACIDANHRCGSIIMLLWSALAAFTQSRGLSYLFGCVTLGWGELGPDPRALYDQLAPRHLAPAEYRVLPRTEPPRREGAGCPTIPPLLKGYLRAGAWICGEPAWDPEFETADLPVLLPLRNVESRYARHFLRAGTA
ncbi:MAG TPA: GNAT family N-acyltransferase [Casimicrobiaceae bacterium]|nr:GNAT family N-acyltransferase [Casimicrobiaceae bacterium]